MPKRVLKGKVVSNSADKTISVVVVRKFMHPIYKKFVHKSKKYLVHDDLNICHVGDDVIIQESRPLSKNKSWVLLQRNV